MRAMAQKSWGRGEPLTLVELSTPEPRDDEVRVSVKAIGVNPVDWKMRSKGPLRFAARLVGPPPPVVVGVDFAGVVDAVGARCSTFKPGQRVFGGTNFARKQRGSYADVVLVREDQLCPVPDHVDLTIAGALPVTGATAQLALMEIGRLEQVPPDARRVLVLGASGGVGQLAVQLARRAGAHVVGVCSTANVALVRSLGAHDVIDYKVTDALVEAGTLGPYQVIADCAGGYAYGACRKMLRAGGRHAMVAGDSGRSMVQVLVPPFTSRAVLGKPTAPRLRAVMDAVAAGELQVAIAQTMPLEQAEEAHRISQAGRLTGKLVLEP